MEANLKKVISETTRLCSEKGVKVEPCVVGYLACLQACKLDGVPLEGDMSAPLIVELSKKLSDQLTSKKDIEANCAKLQVLMEVEFKRQRETVEAEAADVNENCEMLARSIVNERASRDTSAKAYEKSYNRILEYVCVKSHLEHVLKDAASPEAQEVRAASESVFPLSALARFQTLGSDEKAMQIDELARLTLGVLLYNRYAGVGGTALPPPPQAALPSANRLLKNIRNHEIEVGKQLERLTGLLEAALNKDEGPDVINEIREEMLSRAQALVLLETLDGDLDAGIRAATSLETELEETMVTLTSSVGSSTAVSKEVVYPMFDRAGTLHTALQGELRLLVVRHRLLDELMRLISELPAKHCVEPQEPSWSRRASTAPTPGMNTISSTAAAEMEEVSMSLPHNAEYRPPTERMPEDTSLSGFCPVMLNHTGTPLVRGKPTLGTVCALDMVIAFSSPAAFREFSAEPQAVLDNVDAKILSHPVLARLLNRYTPVPKLMDMQQLINMLSGPIKVDFGGQTPVHFVEKLIDRSYEWNQWALRRRALALANLRQKATHGAQTLLSHFKRDGESQVWKPKDATNQTRVNKGQTMPRKLQYVAGLRGAPNVKMNVVRLDLDLGQPHQH